MASGDDGGMMTATPPGPAYPQQQPPSQQPDNVQKIQKVSATCIVIIYVLLGHSFLIFRLTGAPTPYFQYLK